MIKRIQSSRLLSARGRAAGGGGRRRLAVPLTGGQRVGALLLAAGRGAGNPPPRPLLPVSAAPWSGQEPALTRGRRKVPADCRGRETGPAGASRLPARLSAHVTTRKRLPLRSGRLRLPAYPMPHVTTREPPPPRAVPPGGLAWSRPRSPGPRLGGREGSGGRVPPAAGEGHIPRGHTHLLPATHTQTHKTISEFFYILLFLP